MGACNCGTKTPEVVYHAPGCKYRLICERDDARELAEAIKVELNARLMERTQGLLTKLIEVEGQLRKLQSRLRATRS